MPGPRPASVRPPAGRTPGDGGGRAAPSGRATAPASRPRAVRASRSVAKGRP